MSTPYESTGSYRPDVDGLRAVAVLSVILFHLRATLLPGGYIGVDVFFVISGFLITRNICQELEAGRFSILEFYRRRVKRIAPAMLAVVLVTLIAAQLLMLPDDARDTVKSAVYALFSLANVYFWRFQNTGYFAPNSSELPLLHLWSLGVEEQFYIIWPILLVVLYRARRRRPFMLVASVVAIGSFYLGQVQLRSDPSFSYYMLPARAGELLLGGLVAVGSLTGVERSFPRALVTPTATLGMALLLLSLLRLSERYPFPGWLALPPTVGTAAVIFAGHCGQTWVSRVLGTRPSVWVGRISYSAYLWHWPLLALYRYGYGAIGSFAALTFFVLTLGLAWLSYQYIETPLRRSTATALRVFSLQYALPASALLLFAVCLLYPSRYGITLPAPGYQARLTALNNDNPPGYWFKWVCQRQRLVPADAVNDNCVLGADSTAAPKALLWGDSNAAHYIKMLEEFAKVSGFRFRNIEIGSCPPLDVDPRPFVKPQAAAECRESLALLKPVVASFPVIMISSSWTDYQRRSATFLPVFFDMARRLADAGKLVILIGKAPEMPGYDRLCRAKALSYPLLTCGNISLPVSNDVRDVNEQLRRFAAHTPNVRYFDATSYLCPQSLCSLLGADGRPQYYDPKHLSVAGSDRLGREILEREGVPAAFAEIPTWVYRH